MKFEARVWKFGDNINTDLILPIPVVPLPLEDRPQHMFRANRPGWAADVRRGDILVAGRNYGMGSNRPAAQVMRDLKIKTTDLYNKNAVFSQCFFYVLIAIVVFFRRRGQGQYWTTLVLPGLGALGLAWATGFLLLNWRTLVGGSGPIVTLVPWLLVAVTAVGVLLGLRIRKRRPARYARPASRRRASPAASHWGRAWRVGGGS